MGRRPVRWADSETEETTRRPAGRAEGAHLRRPERLRRHDFDTDFELARFRPQHFQWQREGRVGIITLNRPERKNPLTFESYAELRDFFRALVGRAGSSCARHHRSRWQLLLRRRRARDHRPADPHGCRRLAELHTNDRRPGEGHARLSAADHRGGGWRLCRCRCDPRHGFGLSPRYAARQDRVSVHASRAGRVRHGRLRDSPRIIGQGRASELLFTGRSMSAEEGLAWGFFNRLVAPETVLAESVRSPPRSRRARRSRMP